jgi:hypothetical protein
VRWLAAASLVAGLGTLTPEARAVGVASEGTVTPVQHRVALAVGPTRQVLWSQLRFEGDAQQVAIVLPVPAGAALDWSSRAFFEALEVASAARVVPPEGVSAVCPGEPEDQPVHVTVDSGGATLQPVEALILGDMVAVTSWLTANDLTISPGLSAALQASAAEHYFVARFNAPSGSSLTPALRATLPGSAPILPLVLTEAKQTPLSVVTWAIGEGRATFDGKPATLDLSDLLFDVGAVSSNYEALVDAALSPSGSVLFQMSSHQSLRDNLSVGSSSIDGFVTTYFERAATYGDATGAPGTCIAQSAAVLGQSSIIGTACPTAGLGVAGGGAPCSDIVQPGEVDPDLLRCGGVADDLAVFLSDLEPDESWLTRAELRIPSSSMGSDVDVSFPGGPRVDPIVEASSLDLSGCGGGGQTSGVTTGAGPGGPGSGPGSGPGAGSGAGEPVYVEVPVVALEGCACNGTWVTVDYVEANEETAPEAYYDEEGDACAGDTSESYESDSYGTEPVDDCASDTTDTYDGGDTEDCASDTTDTYDSGGDDCSSDTSSSSDSCDSDSGAPSDSCGSDSGDDCSIRTVRDNNGRVIRRGPRLSAMFYLLVVIVLPLRRWKRRKRA